MVTRSASRRDHRALSIPRDLISCLTKGVTPFPYRCDRSGSSRSFLSFSSETRDLLTRCSLSRHALSLVRKDATMEKRATRYRGYLIEGQSPGLGWLIEAHPTQPDLPILRRAAFRVPNPSWRDAVAQARAHIDAALSLGAHMSAGTVYMGGSDRRMIPANRSQMHLWRRSTRRG